MLLAGLGVVLLLVSIASLEAQRRGRRREATAGLAPLAMTVVGAFSLTIVQLPRLIGDSNLKHLLVLAPLAVCIAYGQTRMTTGARGLATTTLVLYITFVAVAVVRGAHRFGGVTSNAVVLTISIVTVALFVVVLLASARDEAERRERLIALALAPVVYVGAADLLHLAGYTSENSAVASGQVGTLASLVGLSEVRIVPPLGDNVNSFGAVAGAGIASCLALWGSRSIPRWLALSGLLVCFYGLLLPDSRNALVSGVVVGVLIGWIVGPRLRAVWLMPLILPFTPLVVLGVAKIVAALVPSLSRGGADLVTGNNRVFIWRPAWEAIKSSPPVEALVGWGANGQGPSGAAQQYARFFAGSVDDPNRITTHNVFLQTVIDTGWIGLAVFLAAALSALAALRRREKGPESACAAIVIVLLLAGMTEAVPTYIFGETLFAFVIILTAAAVPAWQHQEQPAPAPAAGRMAPVREPRLEPPPERTLTALPRAST